MKTNVTSVQKWESGLSMPNADNIIALAKLFGTTSDYLLGLSKSKTPLMDSFSKEEAHIIEAVIRALREITPL